MEPAEDGTRSSTPATLQADTTQAAPAGISGYRIDRARSYLLALTGKSGLFSFAGHEHAILATGWSADLTLHPDDLEGSSFAITIPVASLVIDSAEVRRLAGLGSGPDADDVRTIRRTMLGPRALDAATFPTLGFSSTSVVADEAGGLILQGRFSMHGHTRVVSVPVRYRQTGDGGFEFAGNFTLKQTDFGIEPQSVALGTVHVKDEVRIRLLVVLVPGP